MVCCSLTETAATISTTSPVGRHREEKGTGKENETELKEKFLHKTFPQVQKAHQQTFPQVRKALQQTFPQIQKPLQQTFPKIFGGKFICKPFPQISPTNNSSDLRKISQLIFFQVQKSFPINIYPDFLRKVHKQNIFL